MQNNYRKDTPEPKETGGGAERCGKKGVWEEEVGVKGEGTFPWTDLLYSFDSEPQLCFRYPKNKYMILKNQDVGEPEIEHKQ